MKCLRRPPESLGCELLHEVHHNSRRPLLAPTRSEPLSAIRALWLAYHSYSWPAPGHLLNVHSLQLGDQTLRSLGGAKFSDTARRVLPRPLVGHHNELDLVTNLKNLTTLYFTHVEEKLLSLLLFV